MFGCVLLLGLGLLGLVGCRSGGPAAPVPSTASTAAVISTTTLDPKVTRTATGANGYPRDDRLGPPASSGPSDGGLAPGNCFDEFLVATATQTTHGRTAKPCQQPHDGETFAVLSLQGDAAAPFPGEGVAERLAQRACLPAFEGYVGREYAVSQLRIALLRPTGSTWVAGDRTVVCSLYHQDLVPLTAPAQGSRL